MLADPIGAAVGSLGCGFILRATGQYGIVKVVALAALVGGGIGYCAAESDTAVWLPELYLFLIGFGFGGALTAMLLALLSAIKKDMQAIATGISYAGRAVGATLGVTISGAVFRYYFRGIEGLGSQDIESGESQYVHANQRDQMSEEQLTHCMGALRAVFVMTTAFSTVAFILGAAMRNYDFAVTTDDQQEEEDRAASSSA